MKRYGYVIGLLFSLSAFGQTTATSIAVKNGTEIARASAPSPKPSKVAEELSPEQKYPVLQWKGYLK